MEKKNSSTHVEVFHEEPDPGTGSDSFNILQLGKFRLIDFL